MKFTVHIELSKVEGDNIDDDTLIDAFCGAIGRDNGARKPLRLTIGDKEFGGEGEPFAVYEVKGADDRG